MSRSSALLVLFALAACTKSDDDGFGNPPIDDDSAPPQVAPTVTLTSPTEGASFGTDQAIALSGVVSDDSAREDLVVVVWVDTAVYDAALTWTGDAFDAALNLSTGDHTIEVRASDPDGNTGSAAVNVNVIADQPPTAPVVVIEPSAPVTGDGLYVGLTTTSTDPEGMPVTYDYAWTRDGVAAPEYSGDNAVPAGVVHYGETWAVSVTASDGVLESSPASASVLIGPVGPTLSVRIDPAAPVAADTLICTYTVEEPDGQPVTSASATWLVNGAAAGDAALPLVGAFVRGDAVDCVVTATSTRTASATASVSIGNTPPELSSVTLDGAPATETSALACTSSGFDADGDAISFATSWLVNGAVMGSAATLDGAAYNKGDEVWCSATASDGVDTSAALESAHTVVENTPPTAGGVAIGPAFAVPGTLVSCTETAAATDADPADTLTTTVHWWVNNIEVSAGTDWSYDTTSLAPGDAIACQIEASDGTASAYTEASMTLSGRLSGAVAGADVTITGSVTRGYLGVAIEAPGDIDGDGWPELAIAGTGYGGDAGAVFLWSGADLSPGTHADTDATWTFTGPSAGDMLGDAHGLAASGDIDGDGRPELLLGADRLTDGITEQGAVFLLLSGGSGGWSTTQPIDAVAALQIVGDAARDRLGGAMAGEDLDGDGVADLVVGAGLNDAYATSAGQVAVFLDPATLSGALSASDGDVVWTGGAQGDRLGLNAITALGDIDGDGYTDLALGAPTADGSLAADSGAVYVLSTASLSSGLVSAVAALRIDGFATDDDFGMSVTALGDLDQDGLDDYAIGARFADVWVTDAGGTYVWFGSGMGGVTTVMSSDACWGSNTDGDRLGYEMSSGDIDGDGQNELTVGTYSRPDGASTYVGAAWLLLGSEALNWPIGGPVDDIAQAYTLGSGANAYLGRDPAILGDVSGDGYGEWVVGAQSETQGATSRAGAVYLFNGP